MSAPPATVTVNRPVPASGKPCRAESIRAVARFDLDDDGARRRPRRCAHAAVTDPQEHEHFKVAAAKAIEVHGGRYLVRGGASRALEGDFGSRVVLLELPSYENALGFYRALNTTMTPVQQPADHR